MIVDCGHCRRQRCACSTSPTLGDEPGLNVNLARKQAPSNEFDSDTESSLRGEKDWPEAFVGNGSNDTVPVAVPVANVDVVPGRLLEPRGECRVQSTAPTLAAMSGGYSRWVRSCSRTCRTGKPIERHSPTPAFKKTKNATLAFLATRLASQLISDRTLYTGLS
jgi:hypothetical protein